MNYTPIEWMALVFILVVAVKLIVILVNPRTWYDSVVKKVWKSPGLCMIVSLVLAALTLYYLLQEITIVQILAVMLFLALLMAVGMSVYQKEILALADKMLKDKTIIKKSWLYIIIWIALVVWGAGVLFGFI